MNEQRLTRAQIEWIHEYNGYARLARTPEALLELIAPARRSYERTRRVPQWCGVDFLRGWAFYLIRADRFAGGYGTYDEEILSVLEAIAEHDAMQEHEQPPLDPRTRQE